VIAAALHLSEHTLRNHLSSIYGKLGINKRVDLVLHAMEHHLAQPSAVPDQGSVIAAQTHILTTSTTATTSHTNGRVHADSR
ncbi:MAG TPA: LuxR C-terminal-related transcriptional regulator, partial [Burkholderiales bacterium]|nr:LuxR C-terminal-related transcriptional regulator [Burkholderiales bacterium]